MIPKKLPFPRQALTTPCRIEIYSGGLSEDTNLPSTVTTWEGLVNWSEGSKKIYDKETAAVSFADIVIVEGDISPEVQAIEGGIAAVNGVSRRIQSAKRFRNPDGSVFSTEFYLM